MPLLSRRSVVLISVLTVYIGSLFAIYLRFPELQPHEKEHFKYPRTIDDAKQLGRILLRYKEQHFYTVLSGIAAVYLVLQSFAIPGSIFLTILSGYLFNFPIALALVCLCSAAGATICYYLSLMFGRKLMMHYFPDRLTKWQIEIQKQGDHLLNYIIFLRITPILPNWFINLASPVVDVPVFPFFLGTLLGVAPPSFLFIHAGTTLQMMTTANAVWSWNSIALLTFFALLSLAPVGYKQMRKLKAE